jgi:4-hydroxy-4-methyl-2-oxoglutarate aldolase
MAGSERSVGRWSPEVRTLTSAEAAAVAILADHGVAATHEVYNRAGLLDPSMRPIQQGVSLAGPAVTVQCSPADNRMIHMAVEHCRPGDVLVVATDPPGSAGVIGELLATSLRAHGVIGAVVDAGVRDVATLRAMGFPVWSRWISAHGTTKTEMGAVNRAVVCAGQVVEAGAVIVADDDGVVTIRTVSVVEVARAVVERVANEKAIRARLAAGELSADILGLREVAADIGTASAGR